jgi:hypothetical protein
MNTTTNKYLDFTIGCRLTPLSETGISKCPSAYKSREEFDQNASESDKSIYSEWKIARAIFNNYGKREGATMIDVIDCAFKLSNNRDVFQMPKEPSTTDVEAHRQWSKRFDDREDAISKAKIALNYSENE